MTTPLWLFAIVTVWAVAITIAYMWEVHQCNQLAHYIQQTESTLLTPDEVADRLRVHVSTVYRRIHLNELSAIRVGRQWRIHPRSLA